MTAPDAAQAVSALQAVLAALDLPNAATAGGQEIRDRILVERAGHARAMLQVILVDRYPDVAWAVEYLRDRLAEHPADGYQAWAQGVAERGAAAAAAAGGAL